jgi:hypothetical protein
MIQLLMTSVLKASEIPGYIGQQHFRLQDDRELSQLIRVTEDLKMEVARIDQSRSQFEGQLRILENERNNRLQSMNEIQHQIDSLKSNLRTIEASLAELNKSPEANKVQIQAMLAQKNEASQSIQDKGREYGVLKLDLGNINVRLEQVRMDYNVLLKRSQESSLRLNAAARNRDSYRDDLIASIQFINREGANRGQNDGSTDGLRLAQNLGQNSGRRDGDNDGYREGLQSGQARDYRLGSDVGERDGSARARIDGQRDGTIAGVKSANSAIGVKEGEIAGIKRGNESNAAATGTAQGKKAGMERAVSSGSLKGFEIGEKETVNKYESSDLKTVNVNGAFAGSFQRRSPDYPGEFEGSSFNPNVFKNRDVLKMAFVDGYRQQYHEYTRYEFLRRIDAEYNASYDNRYAINFDLAFNRQYPESFEQGKKIADAHAYNRDYPVIKGQAYQLAYEQTSQNPGRSTEEYKQSYKTSELKAYNEKYEQIRAAYFNQFELEVFNENIAAQTEVYRQKRIKEVDTVYSSNAVLSFVNSEMYDGGISGIAKFDGIFQPGETTLHTVTLKNFGHKSALNVSLQLDNGSVVLLPEVAARSEVVIKGAGSSKISQNAGIGSTIKTSLRIIAPLTTNDPIEAKHFESIAGGILKNADSKSSVVKYPLSLTALNLTSPLIKGVVSKLSIGLINQSKRLHTGELKIHVIANSQSNIITREFDTLSSIQSSAQLIGAEVLVTNDADIYRDLSFSATISQNGVVLGVLGSDLVTKAKAQYLDKPKAAVLVFNSDKNEKFMLDALSLLGGAEKVSVLDLSLTSLNAPILTKGLDQKVLVIVDDQLGTNIKSLNGFVAKSKSSSFVFVDEDKTSLKNALLITSLKDAQRIPWNKKMISFTNPHRAEGVVKSSALFQSSFNDLEIDLPLAFNLTLTASDLLAKFKTEINRNTFFTPSQSIKMFSLKALAEVLCINKAYDESGGLFSRNKKWASMIGNDATLFINVLKSATAGDVNEAKLSTILPAIAVNDAVSKAMSSADGISKAMLQKIQNATNDVFDNMEGQFKKRLKNLDSDLYNKAYEKAYIHRPFAI